MSAILIFDKSVLESLNREEALLLERYFFSNIPSVLFLEVLADLKETPRDNYKSAEDRVVALAQKLPITSTNINAAHQQLVRNELLVSGLRGQPVPMHGACIPSQMPKIGRTVTGEIGHYYEESDEEKAMQAWRECKFNKLDELLATRWKETQKDLDVRQLAEHLAKEFSSSVFPKFRDVVELKEYVDKVLFYLNDRKSYLFLKTLLNHFQIEERRVDHVLNAWKQLCKLQKRIIAPAELFPYATYIIGVDIFFGIGLSQTLIQNSKKSKSHIDLQYIYYLPFCHTFTSNDNFHKKVVPLFLRKNQSFIDGAHLKASLKRIMEFQKTAEGQSSIKSHYPPRLSNCAVCDTYDFHNKNWEKAASKPITIDKEKEAELVNKLTRDAESVKRGRMMPGMGDAEPQMVTRVLKLTRAQMKERFHLSDEAFDKILESQNKEDV